MENQIAILNELAATIAVTQANVKGRHVTVTGSHFFSLHEFLDKLYDELDDAKDVVLESVRELGAVPPHCMSQYIEDSLVADQVLVEPAVKMAQSTAAELKAIIASIDYAAEKGLLDPTTENNLTGISSKLRNLRYWLTSFTE